MTVSELLQAGAFEAVTLSDGGKEVSGVYIGDLLSWVMGRAEPDAAWITIMTNINVVAVACLTDVSCVILAEGVSADKELISTASAKGINILSSRLPAYETALVLHGILK